MKITEIGKADQIFPYRMSDEVDYLYSFDQQVPEKLFKGKEPWYLVLSYYFENRTFLAGKAWAYAPPLENSLSFLENYTSLNKIYDDGRGLVYNLQR